MYRFLKCLSYIACSLSEKNAHRMGQILGQIFWWLVPAKRKQLAKKNILRAGITADKKVAEHIAKESILRLGALGVTVFRFPLLTKNTVRDKVIIEGRERLDALVKEGRGCILAATHCGNWELEGATLALEGYPILAVAMKQSNEGFDRFISEYRTMTGELVEYKTSLRDMYRHLKEGYFVGLLCDQDPGRMGILSPFMGENTLTATGPAHFSVLTGLPVVTVLIHEVSEGKHRIVVGDLIEAPKELGKKEAVQWITDEINRRLGIWIEAYPEEWFWIHNRWKSTDRICNKEGVRDETVTG